jgi:hypothetical protein
VFNQLATFFRNQHETLQRILLFVITAFVIVLLLPAEGKFKYEYQKSKPWKHDNLVAPYSFPINKTAEELDAEVETVKANTKLYLQNSAKPPQKKRQPKAHQKFQKRKHSVALMFSKIFMPKASSALAKN